MPRGYTSAGGRVASLVTRESMRICRQSDLIRLGGLELRWSNFCMIC